MPRIGFPRALPSAQAVLFTAFRAVGAMNEGTIEVQSLRTSERKTLVRGAHHGTFVQSGHLLYLRQKMLYVAPMDLKRLELTGPAVPVVEEVARYSTASAGPDP